MLGTLLATAGLSLTAVAAPPSMIQVCHYSGLAGTDKYETLELPPQAAYQHVDEHGTPQAGHPHDYLGPCLPEEETNEPDPSSTSSTSTTTPTSTTTSVAVSDEGEESSTTTSSTTSSTTVTTSATESIEITPVAPSEATTTTEPPGTGSAPNSPENQTPGRSESEVAPVEVEQLPFTGPSTYLIIPGLLLVAFGGFAVFATYGFGGSGGGHVDADQTAFRLGLHRGRHEFTS